MGDQCGEQFWQSDIPLKSKLKFSTIMAGKQIRVVDMVLGANPSNDLKHS